MVWFFLLDDFNKMCLIFFRMYFLIFLIFEIIMNNCFGEMLMIMMMMMMIFINDDFDIYNCIYDYN